MNKKITTIDDLAIMIEKESRTTEKRFNALEEKMEKIALDIKEIRSSIKEIDVRNAVIGLDIRVSKLEGSI
jgi:hypothetical protein